MKNILIIIDEVEFKYFEFNKLVTNFWLIWEFLNRGYNVFVCTKNKLFLQLNVPFCICSESHVENENIIKDEIYIKRNLNEFDIIFFRPDPPVDVDYINATYILSYVENKNTVIMNSPYAIREKNEKLYINEFKGIVPDNIVTSDEKIIKEFLFEKKEIVIKPLNRCFGSGVFYLNKDDKNINTIIKTATNESKTMVMVQEYLSQIKNGDKRLIYICGEIFDYCVLKVASNNDFKFSEHNKDTLKFAQLSSKEKLIEDYVKQKFERDGVYMAGLDVIDGKIIEINITSPCFFINEINNIFDLKFEKLIVNKIERYINSKKSIILNV